MADRAGDPQAEADVCLIVEGAYPFVAGGVSSWMHDLIQAQSHLTFHLLVISADDSSKESRFVLPPNVIGLTEIALQQPTKKVPLVFGNHSLARDLEAPLTRLFERGGLADFRRLLEVLQSGGPGLSITSLLNTEAIFAMVERMYQHATPGSSFINYFWSWRALAGGLFSVLLAKLPKARVYHAISTGYAGLAMARATLSTGRPGILTEHGIYNNERRVEIAMATWLSDQLPSSLDIEGGRRDLRNVWIDAFSGYARTCYEACSRITTLYEGNQILQSRDGAPADRLQIIPNGVDYDGYSRVPRGTAPRRPTVALIGRIVPIKDVKTFIRAAALLREMVPGRARSHSWPDGRGLGLFSRVPGDAGPPQSGEHVRILWTRQTPRLSRQRGRDRSDEHQRGAAPRSSRSRGRGGAERCNRRWLVSQILHGRADETPNLGPGGFVTPLSNPMATAKGLADLLLNEVYLRKQYGQAIRARTEKYYNKRVVDGLYRGLYQEHLENARETPIER